MDKILITVLGISGVAFVHWFFLLRKETAIEAGDSVEIAVEGGYQPEVITVKKGQAVTLNFLRKDPSTCLEEVVLPDFKQKKFLPIGERVPVIITPQDEGEFTYSCGMNMYHGKIIVRR